jgi:ubiquitin-protein ligase
MFTDIQENETISASIGLENEHDLFLWNVIFEGPADTLYEVSTIQSNMFKGWFLQISIEIPA